MFTRLLLRSVLLSCVLSIGLSGLLWAAAPQKFALLVGIDRYQSRNYEPLQFAERDVNQLAAELKRFGFKVVVLKGSSEGAAQATLENIRAQLRAFPVESDTEDIVLVALSGHGQQQPRRDDEGNIVKSDDGVPLEDAYFFPVDAVPNKTATMLGLTEVMESLDSYGAINLVLVDFCRNNPDATRGTRSFISNELDGRLPQSTAIMFSCAANQQALETQDADGGHSVFAYSVLQGLRGAAAKRSGEVSWDSLVEYVRDQTDARAREWFPQRSGRDSSGRLQTPHELRNLIDVPVLARVSATPAGEEFDPPPGPTVPFDYMTAQGAQAKWADRIKQPLIRTNSAGMKFVLIPPGDVIDNSTGSEGLTVTSDWLLEELRIALQRGFGRAVDIDADAIELVAGVESGGGEQNAPGDASRESRGGTSVVLDTDQPLRFTENEDRTVTFELRAGFLREGGAAVALHIFKLNLGYEVIGDRLKFTKASPISVAPGDGTPRSIPLQAILRRSMQKSIPDIVLSSKAYDPLQLTRGAWMGQTEVTRDQWRVVMGTEPWKELLPGTPTNDNDGDVPATNVSPEETHDFCMKLNAREAAVGVLPPAHLYGLPSDELWVYACRAGSTTAYSFGSDEKLLGEYGWFNETGDETMAPALPMPVGRKRKNAWGLYDMHGNVWEQCLSYINIQPPEGDQIEKKITGPFSNIHGGSWKHAAPYCRSRLGYQMEWKARDSCFGFRVALTPIDPIDPSLFPIDVPMVPDSEGNLNAQ